MVQKKSKGDFCVLCQSELWSEGVHIAITNICCPTRPSECIMGKLLFHLECALFIVDNMKGKCIWNCKREG